MLQTLLGSKIEMSQAFTNEGRLPVTKVLAGPCVVTQIKNDKKDGYWAIQLGFGSKKLKHTTKPMQGHLKNSQITKGKGQKIKTFPRFLKEVRLNEEPKYKVGDEVKVTDIFSEGDLVSVSGVSKGKGFAGVIKRWGFAGGPRTHGQSDRERAPGSIGQGTTPGRVHKGKKMPGRMGTDQVTVKNLKVVEVDSEKNIISISGAIPGHRGTFIVIKKLGKAKKASVKDEVKSQKQVDTSQSVKSERDDKSGMESLPDSSKDKSKDK